MLTFLDLQGVLPENSISFSGSVVRFEVANLVENAIDLESSVLEFTARLLQSLYDLQAVENAARASQSPPKAPLNFIVKNIAMSATGNPIHDFRISIETQSASSFNTILEP